MAMNKAEKQLLQSAQQLLQSARSLRWPEYDFPTTMTLEEIGDGAEGWFMNKYLGEILKGWSNQSYHVRNSRFPQSKSRGPGYMFRSKVDALRAMRYDMTLEYASKLATVDARIKEASE